MVLLVLKEPPVPPVALELMELQVPWDTLEPQARQVPLVLLVPMVLLVLMDPKVKMRQVHLVPQDLQDLQDHPSMVLQAPQALQDLQELLLHQALQPHQAQMALHTPKLTLAFAVEDKQNLKSLCNCNLERNQFF
jgi:hypothetical protein